MKNVRLRILLVLLLGLTSQCKSVGHSGAELKGDLGAPTAERADIAASLAADIEAVHRQYLETKLKDNESELQSVGIAMPAALSTAYDYFSGKIASSAVPPKLAAIVDAHLAYEQLARGPPVTRVNLPASAPKRGARKPFTAPPSPVLDWHSYVNTRVGVLRNLLTQHGATVEISMLGAKRALAEAVADGYTTAYQLNALNLSYTRNVFVLVKPSAVKVLVTDFPGTYYALHTAYQFYYLLQEYAPHSSLEMVEDGTELANLVALKAAGQRMARQLPRVARRSLVIGYRDNFAKGLLDTGYTAAPRISDGGFVLEPFLKQDSSVTLVSSDKAYYGDVISTFVDSLLAGGAADRVLFTGSSGGLSTQLRPYSVVRPTSFLGYDRHVVLEQTRRLGAVDLVETRHGNSVSPLEQDRAFLDVMQAAAVGSFDVEAALLAQICASRKVDYEFLGVITDFPGRSDVNVNIDRSDRSAKERAKQTVVAAGMPWVTGAN